MKIDDPKPSKYLQGFSEVAVHLTYDGGSKNELFYISQDGTIIEGDVYNINRNPFQANLDKLNLAGSPTFGPADAPITIVEFGDFQCPSCKNEAPDLRKNIPETFPGKVRVVFKDFPLESIHPWARAGAIAGRCVYRQNQQAFWKFFDWIYDVQDSITPDTLNAKVLSWAGGNGVDTVQLGRCIDTKASEAEVNKNIADGKAIGVTGTPGLFINGRKIGGLGWPDMKMVLETELTYLGKR